MKTLYLLRHTKSSWKDPDQQDFDRPLNGRGRKTAPLVGRFIRKEKLRIDLVLCSPTARARQTVALVKESAGLTSELLYDERIYEADSAHLLEVVSQAAESTNVLMVVGHNAQIGKAADVFDRGRASHADGGAGLRGTRCREME